MPHLMPSRGGYISLPSQQGTIYCQNSWEDSFFAWELLPTIILKNQIQNLLCIFVSYSHVSTSKKPWIVGYSQRASNEGTFILIPFWVVFIWKYSNNLLQSHLWGSSRHCRQPTPTLRRMSVHLTVAMTKGRHLQQQIRWTIALKYRYFYI